MDLISSLKNIKILHTNDGRIYVKGSGNRIKIPEMNNDLALFLGLLWGDGWAYDREKASREFDWRMGLVEDDIPLIDEFCSLGKKIFDIDISRYDRVTKVEVYFRNKIIYEILNQVFGFPTGDKIGRLFVPKQIKESRELQKWFLNGVFSTDGKFYMDRGYPRIGVDSATKVFIAEIKSIMETMGLNPRTSTWNRKNGNPLYGITLNGVEQAKMFHKEIGFVGEKKERLDKFVNSPLVQWTKTRASGV